jgi:hypothetical protein
LTAPESMETNEDDNSRQVPDDSTKEKIINLVCKEY